MCPVTRERENEMWACVCVCVCVRRRHPIAGRIVGGGLERERGRGHPLPKQQLPWPPGGDGEFRGSVCSGGGSFLQ